MEMVRAKPEDYEKLAKIQFNSGYDPTYEYEKELRLAKEFLENSNEKVFLARDKGDYLGYISVDPEGDLSVVVSQKFHGKGTGSFMLEFIVDFTKKENYDRLKLEVRKDNQKAINLYQKFNFVKKSEFKLNGKDYFEMELELK